MPGQHILVKLAGDKESLIARGYFLLLTGSLLMGDPIYDPIYLTAIGLGPYNNSVSFCQIR